MGDMGSPRIVSLINEAVPRRANTDP
jgi:hypothetical protein